MNILITRPSPNGEELVHRLRMYGKSAWHLPLIKFDYGRGLSQLIYKLYQLQTHDLIFMMSRQAIYYAHNWLTQHKVNWPNKINYYAIGPNTGFYLNKLIKLPVLYPNGRGSTEDLLQLLDLSQVKGKRALILRGNGGLDDLQQILTRCGVYTSYCECYCRIPIHYNSEEQIYRISMLEIDTLVISSGEMLQQLYTLIPKRHHNNWLFQCRIVVVSERLAIIAKRWGCKNVVIASAADNDALMNVLI